VIRFALRPRPFTSHRSSRFTFWKIASESGGEHGAGHQLSSLDLTFGVDWSQRRYTGSSPWPSILTNITPVLTSWKEIAKYVSKGVRTAQRWERELGFPVRRTKPGTKSTVLAIPGEIDAWVQLQQFPDGQLGSVESERTALFRSLNALRSENRELRCQLAIAHAKLIALEERQSESPGEKRSASTSIAITGR
jgi:hypothetical protein